MIEKNILVNYILTYLNILTKDKSSYFISFCDVELEVFDVLENNVEILGTGINVVYLNTNDYHQAVLLRNDSSKDKIVLFTTKSVKYIDSLKHFSEYSLLPPPLTNPEPWEILRKSFELASNAKLKKHFDTILQLKRPSLSTLFEYILKCTNTTTKHLDNKLLNSNLSIFGCWNSENKNELIANVKLKKMIRYSQPEEIERRLNSEGLAGEGDSGLKKSQKKDIEKLLFQSEYSKIVNKYLFEQVSPYFKKVSITPSANNTQEESISWIYSCQQFWEEGREEHDSPLSLEKEIALNWKNEMDEPYLLQYQAIFKRFDRLFTFSEGISKYSNDIDELRKKIMSNSTNIRPSSKERMDAGLDELKRKFNLVFQDFQNCDSRFPYLLHGFLNYSNTYAHVYLNLLQLVFKDELLQRELTSHGLLGDLLQLFILKDGRNCHLPFFHPFFIIYLNKQKFYYDQLLCLDEESWGDMDKDVLLAASAYSILNYSQSFPINTLLFGNQLYRFDNNFENIPFYLSFITAVEEGSITSIEPNLIYPQVADYIREHPYVNRLELLLAGDFSLNTLVALEEKTKFFLEDERNLLDSFTLNIVTSETGKLRKELDRLFMDDQISNRMHLKFFTELNELKGSFPQAIKNRQLVFILDSQFLYNKPQLQQITNLPNTIKEDVLSFKLSDFINSFNGIINRVAVLWDTLHGTVLNGNFKLSFWEFNQPNHKMFGDIGLASLENPASKIVVFSSNTNISDYIFVKKRLSYSIKNNHGSDVLQLVFSTGETLSDTKMPSEVVAQFPLMDIMDADNLPICLNFDDRGYSQVDFSNIYIQFILNNVVSIKVLAPKDYSEFMSEEDIKDLADKILNIFFADHNNTLLHLYCGIVENSLYAHCYTYAQAFFCHYIKNHFIYNNEMGICVEYGEVFKDNISFNSSRMKIFCEKYLPRIPITSEAFLSQLYNEYKPDELSEMAKQAKLLSCVNDDYYKKIFTLLEKVK